MEAMINFTPWLIVNWAILFFIGGLFWRLGTWLAERIVQPRKTQP